MMATDTPTSPTAAAGLFETRFRPGMEAPGAHSDPNDIVLFVHIPKTAGVSLGKSLQQSFGLFRGVDWSNTRESFQEQTREALYMRTVQPCRQVISGHFGWPELAFWRNHDLPIKAISVIRDPYARFVSNYNYNCSEKHPANAKFKTRFPTLRDYAESLTTDAQIKQLIGLFYSFEHALEKLHCYYVFLGVTEKMDASLAHLSRSLDLPEMPVHRVNTATERGEVAEIDTSVRDIVMEKSANDARLHQLLLSFY